MELVRSARNPRVAEAIRLQRAKRRTESGKTLLEGPHLLDEAIQAAAELQTIFVCEGDEAALERAAGEGFDVVRVADTVMKRLAGTWHPRGPVAVMAIPPNEETVDRSVMVAWGVGDPGNAGTLIRSAAAFELGFLAGPGTADPWSPKVLRAAAGSHFRTTIERANVLSVDVLQSRGFTLVASIVEGGDSPARLASLDRVALLIGDEGSGLPAGVIDAADILVTIPMPGHTESLNAAVAGSLLAYELTRTKN